jgi:hypothetical protein
MEQRILKVDAKDNVGVATAKLELGTIYGIIGTDDMVTAKAAIAFGHKIALVSFASGEAIVKYGEVIGHARGAIGQGEHIHTHNLDNLI